MKTLTLILFMLVNVAFSQDCKTLIKTTSNGPETMKDKLSFNAITIDVWSFNVYSGIIIDFELVNKVARFNEYSTIDIIFEDGDKLHFDNKSKTLSNQFVLSFSSSYDNESQLKKLYTKEIIRLQVVYLGVNELEIAIIKLSDKESDQIKQTIKCLSKQ